MLIWPKGKWLYSRQWHKVTDREVSRLGWMYYGSWGSHHVSCCWILGSPWPWSSGSGRRRCQTIWDRANDPENATRAQSCCLARWRRRRIPPRLPLAPRNPEHVGLCQFWPKPVQAQTSIRSDQQTTLWPDLITVSWLSPGETHRKVWTDLGTLKIHSSSVYKINLLHKLLKLSSLRVFCDRDFLCFTPSLYYHATRTFCDFWRRINPKYDTNCDLAVKLEPTTTCSTWKYIE